MTSRVQVLSNRAAAFLARGLYAEALIDAQRCMTVRMMSILMFILMFILRIRLCVGMSEGGEGERWF